MEVIMHYTRQKPTYEEIRNIPVLALLEMNDYTLKRLERDIQKELNRAHLALKWIKGVRRIKRTQGGQNG